MADFQPSRIRGIDFGALDRESNQTFRMLNEQTARQDARHDKEFQFISGLVGKGYKVKVLRAEPKFNSITDSEWNILAETERLRNEQKKQDEQREASLGTGGFEGLAEQGVTAEGGTAAQKRAFGDRLSGLGALNDPNILNQIGGGLDTERQRRADLVAGQGLEQLGERAVAVDTEQRGLARALDREQRVRATPQKQVEELTARYYLDLAAGKPGDPNIKNMIAERAQLDPFTILMREMISGGGGRSTDAPISPADRRRELNDNRNAFKLAEETKGWKIVKPDPNRRGEVDADKAGKLIVVSPDGTRRETWTRP